MKTKVKPCNDEAKKKLADSMRQFLVTGRIQKKAAPSVSATVKQYSKTIVSGEGALNARVQSSNAISGDAVASSSSSSRGDGDTTTQNDTDTDRDAVAGSSSRDDGDEATRSNGGGTATYRHADGQNVPNDGETEQALHNLKQLMEPNQPDGKQLSFPVQEERGRKYYFQVLWFQAFTWLHWSHDLQKILCFYCAKAHQLGIKVFAKNAEPTFVTSGFNNWKKAKQKFEIHEKSQSHTEAASKVAALQSMPQKSITTLLSTAKIKDQKDAREALLQLFSALRFLARQGLACRGHTPESSNFMQLLGLLSDFCPNLKPWLKRSRPFTHADIQNEMLGLMANDVLRNLLDKLHATRFKYFSLIVDGTTDVSGKDQMSICIRYINSNLIPEEIFLGLFDCPSSTAETITEVITNVLLRCNLSIDNLRGQCYDGAANMRGAYTGVQARLSSLNSRALYVHCSNHCINLAAQECCKNVSLIRDCLEYVHQCAIFFRESRVRSSVLSDVVVEVDDVANDAPTDSNCASPKLRTICPTRWTVRAAAIRRLLQRYPAVLSALSHIAENFHGQAATTARGLHDQLEKGGIYLGMLMCLEVIGPLDALSTALQRSSETVSGMQHAVKQVKGQLESLRTDTHFHRLWNEAQAKCEEYVLTQPSTPRARRPPKRLEHSSTTVPPTQFSPETFYRRAFFEFVDLALSELSRRFEQPSFHQTSMLESLLLNSLSSEQDCLATFRQEDCQAVLLQYPEINLPRLELQLRMISGVESLKMDRPSLEMVAQAFSKLPRETQDLFGEFERLLHLLLVLPASVASAERSFSMLRRLKTWLRSTMSQQRLNHCAVLHAHQEAVDSLDLVKLCRDFVNLNDSRRNTFGLF